MYNIKNVNRRYFEVKLSLDDGEKECVINVKPPSVKIINELDSATKGDVSIQLVLTEMLNRNKEKIDTSMYVEDMDYDEIKELLTEFYSWLNNTKNSKN